MFEFPGPTLIQILWEGPMSCSAAMNATGDQDYGLYALYGTHDIFGPDALLYVGEADEHPFPSRIGDHEETWCRLVPI
jgi:hypothetical protein